MRTRALSATAEASVRLSLMARLGIRASPLVVVRNAVAAAPPRLELDLEVHAVLPPVVADEEVIDPRSATASARGVPSAPMGLASDVSSNAARQMVDIEAASDIQIRAVMPRMTGAAS
jgi:hypothetical protein